MRISGFSHVRPKTAHLPQNVDVHDQVDVAGPKMPIDDGSDEIEGAMQSCLPCGVGGTFPDLGKNVNPVLGNFGKFVVGAIPLDNISQIGELFRS